ncbi:MAG: hypothetical protein PHQ65_15160 [Bacteroidales bacterium]|nr:hypothetical protein [Bacteroidales bacterium]
MNYLSQETLLILTKLMICIGALAVTVSIITEGLKSFERINKVPTKIVVLCTSIVVTPLTYVAAMAYLSRPIEWFYLFASFLAAFVVAKVSISGWDDIFVEIKRCINSIKSPNIES